MTTATTPRADVYTRVTAHIIEELDRGVRRGSSLGTAPHFMADAEPPIDLLVCIEHSRSHSGDSVIDLSEI